MRSTLRAFGIAAALICTAYLGTLLGSRGETAALAKAAESAADARYALLHATTVMHVVSDLKRQRDSLTVIANQANAERVTRTASAVKHLAALGPEPTIKPDTCKDWIDRAQKAERTAGEAVEATTFAEIEIGALRMSLTKANESIVRLEEGAATARPVLAEHTGVRLPGARGFHLAGLLPGLVVGYGGMLSPSPAGLQVHQGAFAGLGYRISFGKLL